MSTIQSRKYDELRENAKGILGCSVYEVNRNRRTGKFSVKVQFATYGRNVIPAASIKKLREVLSSDEFDLLPSGDKYVELHFRNVI